MFDATIKQTLLHALNDEEIKAAVDAYIQERIIIALQKIIADMQK